MKINGKLHNEIQWERGISSPLGVSRHGKGVNFALLSEHASNVKLCLFTPHSKHPFAEFDLDPDLNRTGYVWHILLRGLPTEQMEYGYKIAGPAEDHRNAFDSDKILSDP